MRTDTRQFDDHNYQTLRSDLRQVTESDVEVPAETDQTIRSAIDSHFHKANNSESVDRRVAPWWLGVAALLAIGTSMWWLVEQTMITRPPAPQAAILAKPSDDFDGNGRIDILDAFTLARKVKASKTTQPSWDITGDGRINSADIDALAFAAVSLKESTGS